MSRGLRWQPTSVKSLVKWHDPDGYPVSFVIRGNHEDPNGNPVPYERMTQRSKGLDPTALRYKRWKIYVLQCWTLQLRRNFPCDPDGYYRLDAKCFFVGHRHADPDNVRKGIQDALFVFGDKRVTGSVDFDYVEAGPRVEVRVDKLGGSHERTAG
jgi:hypothetical protein